MSHTKKKHGFCKLKKKKRSRNQLDQRFYALLEEKKNDAMGSFPTTNRDGSGQKKKFAATKTATIEVHHFFFCSEVYSIWELKTCPSEKTDLLGEQ